MKTPPLALYAHFPWCVQKCPYCDFNSYALKDPLPETRYIEALKRDLDVQARDVEGRELVSVFLGGGTPSLFSPESIGEFLRHAQSRLGFADAIEITMEANPGTIERGRFAEYRAAGVNRVSLGAQTFDAGQLQALGRIHSADETRRAAGELHAAGIANFNLDLMYALPGQSPADAAEDLRQALALDPAHVSQYHLTIEPGTLFAAAPPIQPPDEIVEEMLTRSLELLNAAGLEQYEVSGYARQGARCEHNLNYWTFGDYLGVGAGAHGKITDAGRNTIVRTRQWREPRRYLGAEPGAHDRHALAPGDLTFEFAMNGFRLVEGFSDDLFTDRTGLPPGELEKRLEPMRQRGLVARQGDRWQATVQGYRFLNEILVELLPPADPGPRSA